MKIFKGFANCINLHSFRRSFFFCLGTGRKEGGGYYWPCAHLCVEVDPGKLLFSSRIIIIRWTITIFNLHLDTAASCSLMTTSEVRPSRDTQYSDNDHDDDTFQNIKLQFHPLPIFIIPGINKSWCPFATLVFFFFS